MKKKRFTEEQIIGALKEHESGAKVDDICRRVGIASVTLYNWRSKYGGLEVNEAKRLRELATQYPRYGYLMLHSLLKTEGLVINKKRTYHLYTALGLQVRTKKRKKLIRPRMPMVVPIDKYIRWSMDFVSDQLSNGRRFRVLNIVDDYSREMIGQLTDFSIPRANQLEERLSVCD